MMPLTATIEVPASQTDGLGFQIALRIMNHEGHRIAVVNPDMGIPAPYMNWPWSNETYQTSLLISFGYLSMTVTDETGHELSQHVIQAWATPVLRPRIELSPGDAIEFAIPIGNFYQLASGRAYQVTIEYGDREVKVSAQALVNVA